MSQVNFLPESYYRKRRGRKRMMYEIIAVIVVIAAMASWYQKTRMDNGKLEQQVHQLKSNQAVDSKKNEQIARLQTVYQSLSKQVKVRREVSLPIGHTQIIAAIAKLIPDSIGLMEISVRGERPSPKPVEAASKVKSKVKTKTKTPAINKRASLAVDLVGLSPDDSIIADFVGRLAENAMFTDVKLEYTRSAEVDRLIGRRFRVTFKLPIDRDYKNTATASAPGSKTEKNIALSSIASVSEDDASREGNHAD